MKIKITITLEDSCAGVSQAVPMAVRDLPGFLFYGGEYMSEATTNLSLEKEEELYNNIQHVQGVLDLLYCGLSSEHPINENDTILQVINDAENKMAKIEESFKILTAAC